MNKFKEFVLADWGTSNLRVWIISVESGEKKQILSSLGAGRLEPNQFYGIIKSILVEAGVKPPTAGRIPVLICGMAGSRNGWKEANYLPVPISCFQVLESPVYIQTEDLDVYILPGLAQYNKVTPDVMRGEETQLLGLCVHSPNFSGLVCLPGTHSKWVLLERGVVRSFQTAMTGELFALLAQHSVLRHVIGKNDFFDAEETHFKEGVLVGYNHPERIIFDIFSVRAKGLLWPHTGGEAAAHLSGILIGGEISAASNGRGQKEPCALIATGRMHLLYKKAFNYLKYDIEEFDADLLAQTGLNFAAQQIINIK